MERGLIQGFQLDNMTIIYFSNFGVEYRASKKERPFGVFAKMDVTDFKTQFRPINMQQESWDTPLAFLLCL